MIGHIFISHVKADRRGWGGGRRGGGGGGGGQRKQFKCGWSGAGVGEEALQQRFRVNLENNENNWKLAQEHEESQILAQFES